MRERTAYHEAGHAVVAYSQRKRLHKVSIKADHDKGLLGYVRSTVGIGTAVEYGPPDNYLRRVTENVTIYLAGAVAEQQHIQGRHNWEGASSDRHAAVDLACRIMSDDEVKPYFKWLMVRTRNLVKWRWPAIEALAGELLVRDEMSGAATTAFIRQTLCPPIPAEAIDRVARALARA